MKTIFKGNIRFSIGEQIRLARRISALLGSGMDIAKAFMFIERSMSGKHKKIIAEIIVGISQGQTCSETISKSGAFNLSLVHMITIGEKSGQLETAFSQAAGLMEKRQLLSRKMYGALIYPVFIACATAGIALFLVVYIFPKIVPLITSMNIPLPFLTKILIFVSHILIQDWFLIVVTCSSLCLCGFVVWKYVRLVRRAAGIILSGLPMAGSVVRNSILIRIFRPLGILISHGEHIPEALISISGIIANEEYADTLRTAAGQVTCGESFSGYMATQTHLFPQLVIDFLETGEQTGGIAAACEHIAFLYETEVDESIKHISTIIEPVLMLGMGAVVGGIALSIVMPIYEITSYLSK